MICVSFRAGSFTETYSKKEKNEEKYGCIIHRYMYIAGVIMYAWILNYVNMLILSIEYITI